MDADTERASSEVSDSPFNPTLRRLSVGVLGESRNIHTNRTNPSRVRGALSPGSSASIHIQFRPEAEEVHLPVALASMTAKLVRELTMARFNRYWSSRMPGLKPTAGYVQDARRWLVDVEGVLCDDEREAMVRKA